jgi:hypothetical protein
MNAEPITGQGSRAMRPAEPLAEWLKVVRAQVESLKFGTVQITVHNSKVLQIERIERTRLDLAAPSLIAQTR